MAEHLYKILDPRLDLRRPTTFAIEDGARLVNFEVTNTASSGAGGSSLTWSSANPPGPGVVVDKKIIVALTYRLDFTRTSTGVADAGQPVIGFERAPDAPPLVDPMVPGLWKTDRVRPLGTDAPRFLPIAQTTSVMNVTINNANANGAVYDWIEPLMRYTGNRDWCETQLSLAPATQDQYQAYGDWFTYGASRNVLAGYGENPYETLRGGYPLIWVERNDLMTDVVDSIGYAVVYLTSYEPVFISPADFGMANQRGFYGVKNFRLVLNTTGDLSRVWSHNGDVAKGGWPVDLRVQIAGGANLDPTGVTYSCGLSTGLPALYFTYLTPKILETPYNLNTYPYFYLQDEVAEVARTVDSFAQSVYKTNSFQLNTVPKYLYVYVRKNNATRTFNDTDTYAYISNLSITFANNPNQLSNAQPNQLYSMSVKNGCKLSWAQWTKYVGSVICVDFSQDISLPDNTFVGQKDANNQLTVQVTFTNISDEDAVNFAVYTVPVFDGVFDITAGQAQAVEGITTINEYINASSIPYGDYNEHHNFYGGNFGSKLRQYIPKAAKAVAQYGPKVAKLAADYAPTVAKYVAPVVAPRFAPVIEKGVDAASDIIHKLVGSGYSQAQAKKMLKDGSYVHAMQRGGARVGKKAMKSQQSRLIQRSIGY